MEPEEVLLQRIYAIEKELEDIKDIFDSIIGAIGMNLQQELIAEKKEKEELLSRLSSLEEQLKSLEKKLEKLTWRFDNHKNHSDVYR